MLEQCLVPGCTAFVSFGVFLKVRLTFEKAAVDKINLILKINIKINVNHTFKIFVHLCRGFTKKMQSENCFSSKDLKRSNYVVFFFRLWLQGGMSWSPTECSTACATSHTWCRRLKELLLQNQVCVLVFRNAAENRKQNTQTFRNFDKSCNIYKSKTSKRPYFKSKGLSKQLKTSVWEKRNVQNKNRPESIVLNET